MIICHLGQMCNPFCHIFSLLPADGGKAAAGRVFPFSRIGRRNGFAPQGFLPGQNVLKWQARTTEKEPFI